MPSSPINSKVKTDLATLLARITAAVATAADMTTLLGRITSTRAGYFDNLSGGAVATAAAIAALPTTPINRIQYVSISLTSASSATATITAVDTAKAFLNHNGVSVSTNPGTSDKTMVRVDLTNTTTVTATRGGSDAENVAVRAVVVEFK